MIVNGLDEAEGDISVRISPNLVGEAVTANLFADLGASANKFAVTASPTVVGTDDTPLKKIRSAAKTTERMNKCDFKFLVVCDNRNTQSVRIPCRRREKAPCKHRVNFAGREGDVWNFKRHCGSAGYSGLQVVRACVERRKSRARFETGVAKYHGSIRERNVNRRSIRAEVNKTHMRFTGCRRREVIYQQ